jgi:hypothetical protein
LAVEQTLKRPPEADAGLVSPHSTKMMSMQFRAFCDRVPESREELDVMAAKAPHVGWAVWSLIVLCINGRTPITTFDRPSEASLAVDVFQTECLMG